MYINKCEVRVMYAETDQMGVIYYGNYARYYEYARTVAIRALGISYKFLEENGIIMPVIYMSAKYIKPAHYDDVLTIETTISKLPEARITFEHKIFNPSNELIHIAEVTLGFLDAERNKPRRAPELLTEPLSQYF